MSALEKRINSLVLKPGAQVHPSGTPRALQNGLGTLLSLPQLLFVRLGTVHGKSSKAHPDPTPVAVSAAGEGSRTFPDTRQCWARSWAETGPGLAAGGSG